MVRKKDRLGLIDIWNAFMCDGAKWSHYDIPFCPTILTKIPSRIITWPEARAIYKKQYRIDPKFRIDAFVCFYVDDYKFDGSRTGIWANPKHALSILSHFTGIITPDFSTYQDFPYPVKLYNIYRMRAFGYWCGRNGLEVVNNTRWGTKESFDYCFDGIEKDSVVAIGSVGGNPKRITDRKRFEEGLEELCKQLSPKAILVYGSANYPCFEKLRELGVAIYEYPSATAQAFKKGKKYE